MVKKQKTLGELLVEWGPGAPKDVEHVLEDRNRQRLYVGEAQIDANAVGRGFQRETP